MKKKTYCNPLDLEYRYQHVREGEKCAGFREGADPTLVLFKGTYYLFVSMSAGFWHSEDLLNWQFHANEKLLPYDYAPDVRQIGEYLYFCASRRHENCPIWRTRDPLSDIFEEVSVPFPFWDPHIFCDDDGRVYFFWGCTNTDPIYGVEMNPDTMMPMGAPVGLIGGREQELGYERVIDDSGKVQSKETSFVFQQLKDRIDPATGKLMLPPDLKIGGYTAAGLQKMLDSIGKPYIEGAFMTKHKGRYYLQYACPGTQYATYADGVYVSEKPLGPYTLQPSNPFSAKPGGFMTGAGHGSTIMDKHGNYWHASTMRISVNHAFERRVGLFPAGFDKDGILYCNQNFADYPFRVPEGKFNAAALKPEWMLLSYKKPVTVSSGENTERCVDEDCRTWWSADSAEPGQWVCVDLEEGMDIRAIQVNLADEALIVEFPADSYGDDRKTRHIEMNPQITNYTLEISNDGKVWTVLEKASRECSNAYFEYLDGVTARYVRLTAGELPYGQRLRVSGLRIFGNGNGEKPAQANAKAKRIGDMDAQVTWDAVPGAQGYNVRYGIAPDKLYLSWMVYDATELKLTTLIKKQDYYVCVDSFNENGISEGKTFKLGE